jgi:hypothetical protein
MEESREILEEVQSMGLQSRRKDEEQIAKHAIDPNSVRPSLRREIVSSREYPVTEGTNSDIS